MLHYLLARVTQKPNYYKVQTWGGFKHFSIHTTTEISRQVIVYTLFPNPCHKATTNSWHIYKVILLNPFHATCFFLYPLKTSENQTIFYVFREYEKKQVTWNGLIRKTKILCLLLNVEIPLENRNREFTNISDGYTKKQHFVIAQDHM